MRRVSFARASPCGAFAAVSLFALASTLAAQRPAPTLPVNPAAAAAVAAAFREALGQPAGRAAVRAEVLRQLRRNHPAALVSGLWVTPADLGSILAAPAVRVVLTAKLGTAGLRTVDAMIADPSRRIGLILTPSWLGPLLMGDLARDILASMGVEAARNQRTDVAAVDDVLLVTMALFGAGLIIGLWGGELIHHWLDPAPDPAPPPFNPNADLDGDGLPNYKDDDDDGDGYNDEDEHYPDDSTRHICDCGRPGAYFGSSLTPGAIRGINAAIDLAQSQLRSAIPVGPVAAGRAGTIRVIVPTVP